MSVDKNVIDELFPHRLDDGRPSYRKNQFEVIRDTLQAFDDGVDDVVVEAPTGTGKTDIAKTVAMYVTRAFDTALASVRHMLPAAKGNSGVMRTQIVPVLSPVQAHMITSMKMLQDAYLHTRGDVCLVKGKANYECKKQYEQSAIDVFRDSIGINDTLSCEDAQLVRGSMCSNCPYLQTRFTAQTSPIALFNFDSFIHQVSLVPDDMSAFAPRALLTLDEAHNTEEKLASIMAVELSMRMFSRLDLPWTMPKTAHIDDVSVWAIAVGDLITRRLNASTAEVDQIKNSKLSRESAMRQAVLAKEVRRLQDIKSRVDRFTRSISSARPADWVAELGDREVRIEPVTARPFVSNALLKYGAKRLHLSATFLDGSGVYSGSVKLDPNKSKYIAVPSTFAVDRRKIFVHSVGNLSYKNFDDRLPDIGAEIQRILDENRGVRGLIHCTSYKLADQIREVVSDTRLVFHGKDDREGVVNDFMSSQANDIVLVGVSLTEGYDFKGDMCRFQILIKIPYPYPTKRVNARNDKQPRYTSWRACLAMVQSYGRGMRSESDWCKTYVLDGRFTSFIKSNRAQLPKWFTDAIVVDKE